MFTLLLVACHDATHLSAVGEPSLPEVAPVVGTPSPEAPAGEAAESAFSVSWSQWCPDPEDWPDWDVMEDGEYVHFYEEWTAPYTDLCLIVESPVTAWYFAYMTFVHDRGTVADGVSLIGMRGQDLSTIGSGTSGSIQGTEDALGLMQEGDIVTFEWRVVELYEPEDDDSHDLTRGFSVSGSLSLRVDLGDYNREYYPEMFPEG